LDRPDRRGAGPRPRLGDPEEMMGQTARGLWPDAW
jgi:hypothetical protein